MRLSNLIQCLCSGMKCFFCAGEEGEGSTSWDWNCGCWCGGGGGGFWTIFLDCR